MTKLLAALGLVAMAITISGAMPGPPPGPLGGPQGSAWGSSSDPIGRAGAVPNLCDGGKVLKTVCEVRPRPPAQPVKVCKQVCVAAAPPPGGAPQLGGQN
jgi:hypothetical protein